MKVCNKCKGTDVWVIVYVNPNDPKIERDISGNDCHCHTCMGECELIDTEHPADKDDSLYHEEQDHKAMEKANDRQDNYFSFCYIVVQYANFMGNISCKII